MQHDADNFGDHEQEYRAKKKELADAEAKLKKDSKNKEAELYKMALDKNPWLKEYETLSERKTAIQRQLNPAPRATGSR